MDDLFVSLDYSKFYETKYNIEGKLEEMIACRHEFPIWPSHGGNPVDTWEEDYHGPIRYNYYRTTLYLLKVVRLLRQLS